MIEFFECVWPRVRRDMETAAVTFGALLLLILLVALAGCLLSGAAAACLPVWFETALAAVGIFLLLMLVTFLTSVLLNGIGCIVGAGLSGLEDFLEDTFGLESAAVATAMGTLPTTCKDAQAALAQAQQDLAAVEAARNAQREHVSRARRRLRAAAAAFAGALLALAAVPFWSPNLIPGAIAAVIAAGALVVRRTRRLADAVVELAAAEAAVARAIAAVGAAAALVAVLCQPQPPSTPNEPPSPVLDPTPPGGAIGIPALGT